MNKNAILIASFNYINILNRNLNICLVSIFEWYIRKLLLFLLFGWRKFALIVLHFMLYDKTLPEIIKLRGWMFFSFITKQKKNYTRKWKKFFFRKCSHIVLYDAPNFYVQYLRYDHCYTFIILVILNEKVQAWHSGIYSGSRWLFKCQCPYIFLSYVWTNSMTGIVSMYHKAELAVKAMSV